jgi:hypothetical protein
MFPGVYDFLSSSNVLLAALRFARVPQKHAFSPNNFDPAWQAQPDRGSGADVGVRPT